MTTKKKQRKIIPKDYKNINKYILSKDEKEFKNEVLILSKECKITITNTITEKFVDFMTPIENIIRDLFSELFSEIQIRYSEIFKSIDLETFNKNLNFISFDEFNSLSRSIEEKIIDASKIIIEKSETFDSIASIYAIYLKNVEILALRAAKLKNLYLIHQIEFIQKDTKFYVSNLLHSINIEAFDLYSEDMDRYFLDLHSFINNNNEVILEHINADTKKTKFAPLLNEWTNEIKCSINHSKHKIFTQYKYKEINKIALNNGFILNRVTGGHGIFINNLGKVVVIPQGRDIGKGLQIKILKSIGV